MEFPSRGPLLSHWGSTRLPAPLPVLYARMGKRKLRLEIHLDADLVEWLRAEAERRTVSLGHIVRVALQEYSLRTYASRVGEEKLHP